MYLRFYRSKTKSCQIHCSGSSGVKFCNLAFSFFYCGLCLNFIIFDIEERTQALPPPPPVHVHVAFRSQDFSLLSSSVSLWAIYGCTVCVRLLSPPPSPPPPPAVCRCTVCVRLLSPPPPAVCRCTVCVRLLSPPPSPPPPAVCRCTVCVRLLSPPPSPPPPSAVCRCTVCVRLLSPPLLLLLLLLLWLFAGVLLCASVSCVYIVNENSLLNSVHLH
ncbi:unnamed protein product [Knipowitschia caucasica]